MPITLAEAEIIIQKSQKKALALGVKNCTWVVDELGVPIAMGRMDGVPDYAVEMSRAKAFTAAKMKKNTREVAEEFKDKPLEAASMISIRHIVLAAGGVVIVKDGQVVGAVGVGGGRPEKDDLCALASVS